MYMIKRVLLMAICGILVVQGYGQEAKMADLVQVIARLNALKTYSYRTETNARFPNGKTDRMQTEVYMDGPAKRLLYKTDFQLLLLTARWAFKADHRNRQASVFDVVKYNAKFKNALPELDLVFKSSLATSYLDSLVIKKARLLSAKKNGTLTTYKLGFPPGFYIRELTLVYDNGKELPDQIRIISFYSKSGRQGEEQGTVYETTCKGYSKTVPENIFDASRYFLVKGNKAQLIQYKNYKLSAIL